MLVYNHIKAHHRFLNQTDAYFQPQHRFESDASLQELCLRVRIRGATSTMEVRRRRWRCDANNRDVTPTRFLLRRRWRCDIDESCDGRAKFPTGLETMYWSTSQFSLVYKRATASDVNPSRLLLE
ncbi:hypothetical protein L3X38_032131 [Prunus dulcis]|uniref:Uncharacterized protein n=1 Tax=Prunus dulcis TaxID=3755 RepID=A0AAD4VEX6_PRUDU|nr:hypothetical protein L3X38_032131 [Prunus dulcis]